jgi:hypothetical protein
MRRAFFASGCKTLYFSVDTYVIYYEKDLAFEIVDRL